MSKCVNRKMFKRGQKRVELKEKDGSRKLQKRRRTVKTYSYVFRPPKCVFVNVIDTCANLLKFVGLGGYIFPLYSRDLIILYRKKPISLRY